jgi:hypothetical protein
MIVKHKLAVSKYESNNEVVDVDVNLHAVLHFSKSVLVEWINNHHTPDILFDEWL